MTKQTCSRFIALMAAGILTAVAVGLSGCAGNGQTAYVQNVGMVCGVGSTANLDRFAGVVETKGESKIMPDAEKTVAEIFVEEGQTVEAGQPLFTYDKDRLTLTVDKAALELDLLKSTTEKKISDKADLERQRDRSTGTARATYTLQVQELEIEIIEAQAQIATKEKDLEALRGTLENLDVVSPVAGKVRTVNPNGGTDQYGEPLPFMVITELGDLRVKAYINEANVGALTEGMPVVVRSRVDSTARTGVVDRVDWDNPASGNSDYYYAPKDDTLTSSKYPFYVTLDSSDGFMVGQHVYIESDFGQGTGEADTGTALNLPSYYIMDADTNPWVWAEGKNGKLEKRSLTLGAYDPAMDTREVLSGLTATDYIAFPEEGLKAGLTCEEYEGFVNVDIADDFMYVESSDEFASDGGKASETKVESVPVPPLTEEEIATSDAEKEAWVATQSSPEPTPAPVRGM